MVTRRFLTGLLAASALAVTVPSLAQAHEYTLGRLIIGHPFSRATPPMARTGAGFLTVTNTGSADDTLVSATTAAAGTVELHTNTHNADGVMEMRKVDGGILIPAGQAVALQPGGLHMMLIGLKEPLKEGAHVPLTLTFAKAGSIDVDLHVEAMGSTGGDHQQH